MISLLIKHKPNKLLLNHVKLTLINSLKIINKKPNNKLNENNKLKKRKNKNNNNKEKNNNN